MERLTTNKPVEEMGMYELAHNGCYMKDGYAWYRDFDTDIDARELARDLMINQNLWEIDSDEVLSDEIFDETMMDNLQYGSKEIEGLIALFYRNLWAMADLHTRLKEHEDAEEQGLILRLPCKVGDTLWWTNAYGDLCSSEVNSMFIEKGIDGIVIETFICNIAGKEIGKTVFLNKEEAEQALARMEGEDG